MPWVAAGLAGLGLEASEWEREEVQLCDLLPLSVSPFNNALLFPWGCQLVHGFLEKASEKVLDPASSDFTR